ncbi:MAG: threonine/serine dehydratase [Ignavibacteria bacterium]|nr:threonine/serine dehydratase [Ignavibacteria bacterium]
MQIPDKEKILLRSDNIKPYIYRTPVFTSDSLNRLTGCRLFFKCENFQKTGSFKARGAMNALLEYKNSIGDKTVITHSSGNFAQALAYGASRIGLKCTVVMPQNAVESKINSVRSYGAEIIFSGNLPHERENKCEDVVKDRNGFFIHPSNDIVLITGHSSCAVELISDAEDLDYVFVPVGGGGLASGIILGFKYLSPETKIIGIEPEGADDAFRSLKAGKIIPQTNPDTIADGLRTSLGEITFEILKTYLHEIITVSDQLIINSMKLIWERLKIISEPSGSVSLAGLLKNSDRYLNKKIGIILSGGNINLKNIFRNEN